MIFLNLFCTSFFKNSLKLKNILNNYKMSFIFSRFINTKTRCIKSNLIVNKYIHTFTKKINNYTIKFIIKEPLSEQEINKLNSFFSKSQLKITDHYDYYNNFDISYENNNITDNKKILSDKFC